MGYTISIGNACICKDFPLSSALSCLEKECGVLAIDEEIDVHIWRED